MPQENFGLSEAQARELEKRIDALEKNESPLSSWDEVRQRITNGRRRPLCCLRRRRNGKSPRRSSGTSNGQPAWARSSYDLWRSRFPQRPGIRRCTLRATMAQGVFCCGVSLTLSSLSQSPTGSWCWPASMGEEIRKY
ncbi:addiction module protein [Methylococcus mesophilus]|uniref:addiction module protein n=1 Tax=Methylococcus mesophilus TaxID=2993564 RepID=UPI0037438176